MNLLKRIMLSICLCCFSVPGFTADITTDVVVIGAGASGTSAALSAQNNGAQVILIEKAPFPAGAGTFAGGMMAADSSQQKREGKTVDKKWIFDKYMEGSNYHANARLVINIINNAGKTVDFLISNGGKFSLVDPAAGSQYWHLNNPSTLHGYQKGGGAKNIAWLQETFKKKGGTLLFENRGIKLIMDNGTVVGVTVEDEEGDIVNIMAKAVVIATGGMGANKEMIEKETGFVNPPLSPVTMAQGDGIRMAREAGAQPGHVILELFATLPNTQKKTAISGSEEMWLLCEMPFMKVNKFGYRFMREDRSTDYSLNANTVFEQPDHMGWMLIDKNSIDKIKKGGLAAIINIHKGHENSTQEYYEFNERVGTADIAKFRSTGIDYSPMLEDGIISGAVVKADTIEELAEKMSIDPSVLKREVSRYNELAAKGNDEDFHNMPEFMFPLEKGPYYAYNTVVRSIGALGGVKVNENLQAVDKEYIPIPGLYVVGNDVTGMYGNGYVLIQGGTLGFAYTSGYIAGQQAAAFSKLK